MRNTERATTLVVPRCRYPSSSISTSETTFSSALGSSENPRPEMRGGEANCAVVVSDEPIGSPLVTEPPILVAMNKPSLVKFMPSMPAGGLLLYNESLISGVEPRADVRVIPVSCNAIAEKLQNPRVSNMAMLGAIQAATQAVSMEALTATLRDWLGEKKAAMLPINLEAVEAGRALVR